MVSHALPQHAVQHLLRAGQGALLPRIINGLLVIWLAWQLAGLTWQLLPSVPAPEDGVAPPPVTAPPQSRADRVDERQLAGWHLFGATSQQPVVQRAAPLDAPETRLRLTLKGVFASDGKSDGWAIIADPKGKEDSYSIGDPLPGGAKLAEIYPDRIILDRNGRFETLKLPKMQGRQSSAGSAARSNRSYGAGNARAAAAFNRYRNEVKRNPSSFLNYVRATPARKNGRFIGFRLQAGKQRGALNELGLKPGDIVTSINGVKIDAPAKGMKAMQALGEGDNVNITLLRGGEEVTLNLTLPTSTR